MKWYHVLAFPSLYGTPIKTNSKVIAYIIAFIRSISYEARVIDNETGEHILVL